MEGWSVAETKKKLIKKCTTTDTKPHELSYMKKNSGIVMEKDNTKITRENSRSQWGYSNNRKDLKRSETARSMDFKAAFSHRTREPNENRNISHMGSNVGRRNEGLGDRNFTIPLAARPDKEEIEKCIEILRDDSDIQNNIYSLAYIMAVRAKMLPIPVMEGIPRASTGAYLGAITPECMMAMFPTGPQCNMDIPDQIQKYKEDDSALTFNRGSKSMAEPADMCEEDNAYLKEMMARRQNTSTMDQKTRERKLQSLLNKLTKSNFDSILAKVGSEDGIQSANDLSFFLTLTFEKAAHMPNFLDLYAKLLLKLKGPVSEKNVLEDGSKKNKKRTPEEVYAAVVTRTACEVYEGFMKDIQFTEELDEIEKLEANNTRKAQRRGLAVFLSELITANLLQHKILKAVLNDIQTNNDEKSIEFLICMCQSLFKQEINSNNSKLKVHLDQYMKTLLNVGNQIDDFRLKCLIEEQLTEWNKRI